MEVEEDDVVDVLRRIRILRLLRQRQRQFFLRFRAGRLLGHFPPICLVYFIHHLSYHSRLYMLPVT